MLSLFVSSFFSQYEAQYPQYNWVDQLTILLFLNCFRILFLYRLATLKRITRYLGQYSTFPGIFTILHWTYSRLQIFKLFHPSKKLTEIIAYIMHHKFDKYPQGQPSVPSISIPLVLCMIFYDWRTIQNVLINYLLACSAHKQSQWT